MRQTIKLNYTDFWGHFDKYDNYFTQILSKRFAIEISDNPDFIIYSCYGTEHLKYNCIRIYYNGENLRTNWNGCDYSFSFDYIENNSRHYRLPNWVLYENPVKLTLPKTNPYEILKAKTGFCNMVVSNPNAKKRIEFFHKLSKYKKVDSAGKVLNNIGAPIKNKLDFIQKYKFTLAFENSSFPGYTTEKLFEPMLVNSIPVYWGNPVVNNDFNTKSFLNYSDYANDEALIEKIIELDQDDDLYIQMLQEPWFKNNAMPEFLSEDAILNQFEIIFSNNKKPVAKTFRNIFYVFNVKKEKILYYTNKIIPFR
jgi:Glycosyltransferase family 10 (fucosyltransferase).